MSRPLIIFIFLIGLSALGLAFQDPALSQEAFPDQKIDPQWIYVKLKEGVKSPLLSDNTHKKLSKSLDKKSPVSNLYKIAVPQGMSARAYCNKLRENGDIVYADPIYQYEPLATNDPLLANQYYLEIIQAMDAWGVTTGDDDITIGIIDTGMELDHPDIISNLWTNSRDPIDGIDNDLNGYIDDYYGYDFADQDPDPSIERGNHGMIVAGIAGARPNNGEGIAGLGYNTKIAALKGFKSSDGTSGGLYEAISYAAENGMQVLNLSWGRMGPPLQSEQDILADAVLKHDVVLVAAAGNEGGKVTEEEKFYPASYPYVLSVGATDENDHKSSGSSFNYAIDIVAPGVGMFSTTPNASYANAGPGTSYAAPLVAATAALVRARFPSLSASQVMERIRVTTDPIYAIGENNSYYGKLGSGRLNTLKALTTLNSKSMRLENIQVSSQNANQIFYGDTVLIQATLVNHLSTVQNPALIVSSPTHDFSVVDQIIPPGRMRSGDTLSVAFQLALADDIPPGTTLPVEISYQDGSYTDFQFLEIETLPDYGDFGNEQVKMTVSGNGNIGLHAYGAHPIGSGFLYEGDTLLKYAGILLASNENSVSDNIISNYSTEARESDFDVLEHFKTTHHPGAEFYGFSAFQDVAHHSGLVVFQEYITSPGENFLCTTYRIINTSDEPISNLSFGVFADWDLDEKDENRAYLLTDQKYSYVKSSAEGLFAGLQIISDGEQVGSVFNTSDIEGSFTNESKYHQLVNLGQAQAGQFGSGDNVATLTGTRISIVPPQEERIIQVIWAVGDSQASLEASFMEAADRLAAFDQSAPLSEQFVTCSLAEAVVNPSAGTDYLFYSDAATQNLIGVGEQLRLTNLEGDTSLFVRNIDPGYPGRAFRLDIHYLEDIADFQPSTDTLYLDHTINTIQFTDQSIVEATHRTWDFDNGLTSTLPNPTVSYDQPGEYFVSLIVSNGDGCTDEITKRIVVSHRPATPFFENRQKCYIDPLILISEEENLLRVYAYQNQQTPIASGTNLSLSGIEQDTTLFISQLVDGFESQKAPLVVQVEEVIGDLVYHPDTTRAAHHLMLRLEGASANTDIRWQVNEEDMGSASIISMPIEGLGSLAVELSLTTSSGCTRILSRTIDISSSPLAQHPDIAICEGEEAILMPANGQYFGFYRDENLSQLIKKGKSLSTTSLEKVYVTNLDDGLPGPVAPVSINRTQFEVQIGYTSTLVDSKHKVSLEAQVSAVSDMDFQWYINGHLTETTENPILILPSDGYEIILRSENALGCTATDTLYLDLSLPLSTHQTHSFQLFPNPVHHFATIYSESVIDETRILSLDGKELVRETDNPYHIYLGGLKSGIYILQCSGAGYSIQRKFVKQ